MNSNLIRWGILSTGNIAHTFARGLRDSKSGELFAVASRNQESADKFAAQFDNVRAYSSYEALLSDAEVDAVYIATPHPLHAQWAIRAADAGKHILCEKPFTLNAFEAARVNEAAIRNNVQLLEAFMYRCHPQTAKIVELIQSGVLGEVRGIEATFGFLSNAGAESRLHDLELGGGGILDVGCYAVSFCRLVAGAAQGKPFANPTELEAVATIGELGCDDYASAVMKFSGEIIASVSTSVRASLSNTARVFGSKANLSVPSPWFCGEKPNLTVEPHDGEKQEIIVEAPLNLYAYEADALADLIRGEKPNAPAQGALDALGNMQTLDRWRAQIGLVYPPERAERQTQSASGEPLRVYPNAMGYGTLAGVVDESGAPKRISKLVLGTMLEGTSDKLSHGLALFDDFFERGGTAFDTAHIYGGGMGEKVLGHWLKTRGVRDQVTILVKGAHPPNCSLQGMREELAISLDRLGIESGDIYMMHRDNLEIPVDEWVDALNQQKNSGKFAVFGGSNWSLQRLKEANVYAQKSGLQGMSVASNNFSLARMVDPVWDGCASSSDAASRQWFIENGLSLFSWSSQARGFFVRASRGFVDDEELVRCWYSDDNFERLNRARELANKKNTSAIVIAAAYVLAQPFPLYALIGPQSLAETRSSMTAFEIELSPDELKWLNLED